MSLLRRRTTSWWIISHHDGCHVDAFAFGPFRSEEKARRYPDTMLGWMADGPAFGPEFSLKVIELPRGQRPKIDSPYRWKN